ncbi:hypothetical protein ACNFR7_05075 [Streptomyces sp. RM1]
MDGIAAALLELIGDEELRRRMGEAALADSARFDPSRIAQRHLDLYADLLRRGPGRRSPGLVRDGAHRVLTRAFDAARTLRSAAGHRRGKKRAAGAA